MKAIAWLGRGIYIHVPGDQSVADMEADVPAAFKARRRRVVLAGRSCEVMHRQVTTTSSIRGTAGGNEEQRLPGRSRLEQARPGALAAIETSLVMTWRPFRSLRRSAGRGLREAPTDREERQGRAGNDDREQLEFAEHHRFQCRIAARHPGRSPMNMLPHSPLEEPRGINDVG